MADRFDLEQQILDCWRITDEIPMMESQGANAADMTSLACVYEFKFKRLWDTFEQMVEERQFKSGADEPKGWVCSKCDESSELSMVPRKRTVWVNLYSDGEAFYHYTQKEADDLDSEAISERIGGKAHLVEIEE